MKLLKFLAVAPILLLSTEVFAQSRGHQSGNSRGRDSYSRNDDGRRYDNDRRYSGARYSSSYARPYSYSSYRPYYPRTYSIRPYVRPVYVGSAYDYGYYNDDYSYDPAISYGYDDYPSVYYRSYGYYPAPRYRNGLSIGLHIGGGSRYSSSRRHR
ncbi:MAG: hypothetical protein ABI672_05665 [Vicinamibacteria bacterium]